WPDNALKMETQEPLPREAWSHVLVTYDGSGKAAGVKVYVNGRPARLEVQSDKLRDTIATSQPLRLGKRSANLALNGELADVRSYRRTLTEDEARAVAVGPLPGLLDIPEGRRSKAQQDFVARLFRETYDAEMVEARARAAKARQEKA